MSQSRVAVNVRTQPAEASPKGPGVAPPTLAFLGVVLLVGLAVGLYALPSVGTSMLAVVGLGVPAIFLAWIRPELGLLAFVFLTSGFVRRDGIAIRLPVGSLDMRDLMLLVMLGLLVIQGLKQKRLTVPWWPVSKPLLVFLGLGIYSMLYAVLVKHVEAHWAFNELRSVMYYATFYMTAWAVTRRKQVTTLLAGLFVLSDITATFTILQQLLGTSNRLLSAMSGSDSGWHVWQADDSSGSGFGTVRIIPPGHVLMYLMMVIAFCLTLYAWPRPRLRTVFALHVAYLNFGLLLTYTRAGWIAAGVALVLVALLLPVVDKLKLFSYLVTAIAAILLFYSLVGGKFQQLAGNSQFVSSLSIRVLSIFTPNATLETDSLGWRRYETGEALRSIKENPLWGVGLGNVYRNTTLYQATGLNSGLGGTYRFTRYLHNSYLYIAVKMGLPGLVVFLWFSLAFMVHGWRVYLNSADGPYKRITLGIVAGFVGLLSWSVSHSHLLLDESTVAIGLVVGLVAAMHDIDKAPAGPND